MFRSVRLSFIAAIGALAATQGAVAAPQAKGIEVGRVTVSYRDLDLSALGDARVLLTRLQKAAFQACGGDPRLSPDYDLMGPAVERVYRECRKNAVSRAVTTVDAPLLTEVHKEEGARRLASAAAG